MLCKTLDKCQGYYLACIIWSLVFTDSLAITKGNSLNKLKYCLSSCYAYGKYKTQRVVSKQNIASTLLCLVLYLSLAIILLIEPHKNI